MKNKKSNFTMIFGKNNTVGDNNKSTTSNSSIAFMIIGAIIFAVILAIATNKDFLAKIKDYTISTSSNEKIEK